MELNEETQAKLEALVISHMARQGRRNERARRRYRLKKEGKWPSNGSREHTVVLPHTRVHDLMKSLQEQPLRPVDIPERDAVQFLRLLKWNVIYISTFDGYVWLNQPVGDDALKQLDQGISATVWKEG